MKPNRRSKQASEGDGLRISVSDENDKKLYERKAQEQESENEALKKEIKELKDRLATVSSSSTNNLQKLKEDYLHKLNALEDQVAGLKNKLDAQSQFSTQKKKIDEPMKQLQYEIQSLKTQKVQLQCKIKLESVQFRLYKASMEKEVLQLKKERRKIQYEMHKHQASTHRLKMVLQRKTEEASFATKRLRELIESRKTSSHKKPGAGNSKISDVQVNFDSKISDVQGIEHELDVTEQLHELCSKYEHQIEEMSEDILKLKEEARVLREEKLRFSLQEDIDILHKDLEINDLKEQMDSLSGLITQLRIQKTELVVQEKKHLVSATSSANSISNGSSNTWTSDLKHSERLNTSKKTDVELCCSCSKKSLCKTTKCRCRSNGTTCGPTCGCTPSKCCNREEDEGGKGGFHGAILHEGSVVEKLPAVTEQFVPRKKPLSDIRNNQTNQGL